MTVNCLHPINFECDLRRTAYRGLGIIHSSESAFSPPVQVLVRMLDRSDRYDRRGSPALRARLKIQMNIMADSPQISITAPVTINVLYRPGIWRCFDHRDS